MAAGRVEKSTQSSEIRARLEKGLCPQVKLLNEAGEEIRIAGTDHPITIPFQAGSHITVKDGQKVAIGEVLARIPQETSKTRDITGGLPRVAERFEEPGVPAAEAETQAENA